MIAIIESYKAGLLQSKYFLPNLIAGIIVGIVALPLAMAFAIASGVRPEQGLYTAIVAGLCVGIFGGSQVQIAGPTGAFIVILANITAQYGVSGLQIATLIAGFILIVMGCLKLGNIIKFIPDPVIIGFTSGIGVIIFVGEWKDFFGLTVHLPLNAHFHQKLIGLLQALPHLNIVTTLLGLLSILLTILTPKLFKRLPGPLLAMLVVTGIQYYFHFSTVATLGTTFGIIPQHLPNLIIPPITLTHTFQLIGPAFTIALLGAIESLLSATAADTMANTRHDSNQELIGQGIANIFSPLFGGFAATGAIARTATNVRNGGNSPIAAITHSVFLILTLILLAPLASNIPLCCLAAILFVVAYNMSDIPRITFLIKKAPHYDLMVLGTTFILTIFTDLVIAVNVGVILAMLLFVRRVYQTVSVEAQAYSTEQFKSSVNNSPLFPTDLLIYTITGPLFFGVAKKIERELTLKTSVPKIVIFRLQEVPFMDITGMEMFYEIIKKYHQLNIKICICEANPKVSAKLNRMDLLPFLTKQSIFPTLADSLKELSISLEELVEHYDK
ncbi:MAG: STAS domain-containing protein [Legionellales bacterium]|nr:STAS domain-containing protein [Legionellales bacterium]